MRGSELLVSGVSSAPNPAEKKLRKQKQPRAKSKKAVRSNRASELRKQQHRQEAEYPDGLQAQQQQQPSPHLRRLYKGRGPSAVFLGSNSDSVSDTDSDSGALPDLHLKIIEPYRSSAGLPRTSTSHHSRKIHRQETFPAAGSGSSSLDLPRLREQLQETERQRSKLKNRLAELAKLMSESMAEEHRPDDAAVAMETAAAKLATVSTDSRYPSDPSVEHDDEDQSESLVSVPEAEDTVENVELPPLEVEKPQTESASVAIQTDQLLGVADKPDLCDRATQSVTSESPQSQQLLEAQSRERQSLLARLKSAAEDCANLRLDREAMRRQLDAAQFDRRMALAEAEEKRADLATARREVDDRDGRLERMAASQVRTEKEVGNLRSQLSELRRQLDSAENSRQAEAAENQRHRAKILSLESQLDSRIQELAAVTNALIEKRRSEEDLLARVQQLQRQLSSSEETVTRLKGQLETEQTRPRVAAPLPPPPPPPPPPKQPPVLPTVEEEVQTADTAAPWPEEMNQRMAELDARINRLIAGAREGVGGGPSEQRRRVGAPGIEPEADEQPESATAHRSSQQVATSTPQAPRIDTQTEPMPTNQRIDLLLNRTEQLEASNQQLAKDVRMLRQMCADLLESRKELKNELAVAKMSGSTSAAANLESSDVSQAHHQGLSDYLFQTETLRAMILRQLRDLQNSKQRLQFRSQQRELSLSQELQSQQAAVDRSWQALQASLSASAQPRNSSSVGAYRDFYLRRAGNIVASKSKAAESTRLIEAIRRHPLSDAVKRCGCRHADNCPMKAEWQ
uniref:Golgin-84 n=1 Tax=Macrostomum lignano TaxID=282301 RepID=A0A1I8HS66_9PLAT